MRDAKRRRGINAIPGKIGNRGTAVVIPRAKGVVVSTEHFTFEIPDSTFDAIVTAAAARTLELLGTQLDQEAWPEWMSVERAAKYLDVSPERLRKLQARREIPFHQEAPGCRVFYRRHDLDDWMTGFRLPART